MELNIEINEAMQVIISVISASGELRTQNLGVHNRASVTVALFNAVESLYEEDPEDMTEHDRRFIAAALRESADLIHPQAFDTAINN